jgi:cytidyltransferase-like protein
MPKKVFVSGCFDMLHSGHVAFFEEAAQFGDLYVAIGSDRNVFELKRRPTINSESERLYMIKALSCVKSVFVAKGSGILDFVQELQQIKPDYFVVNEDGSTPEKKNLCAQLGIEYMVLKREPHTGLTARSTTALRGSSRIPESLDLAGGWLDQPEVSKHAPGPALTVSIHPLESSSATRSAAVELWNARLPSDQPEKLAKILFGYSNLPGTKQVNGSKAAIGVSFAGLTRADYNGEYWPTRIQSIQDEQILKFIEDTLYLLPLGPLALQPAQITPRTARAHSRAAEACWQALLERDVVAFGKSMRASFEAQTVILSAVLQQNEAPLELIARQRGQALGWKICSLGERSALLLVSDQPVENATRICIQRPSD